MKVVILADGLGFPVSAEGAASPKPMLGIGGRPLVWHVMQTYASHGVREFVLALGERADVVKTYFLGLYALINDVSIDLATGDTIVHEGHQPPWRIHMVHTGRATRTGGRLKRLEPWLGDEGTFLYTSGDCVTDLDVASMVGFHHAHKKLATIAAIVPPGAAGDRASRGAGRMTLAGDQVRDLTARDPGEAWVSGRHFVLDREALDYIDGDESVWERTPLERLMRDGQLIAYRHGGFWAAVDTPADKENLDDLCGAGRTPWHLSSDDDR